MNDRTYLDADREAAKLGKMRSKLARWWRPLASSFAGGAFVFILLLAGDYLQMIRAEKIVPWGTMLMISAFCITVPVVPLLIMLPLDAYRDQRMRRAFRRRRQSAEGK